MAEKKKEKEIPKKFESIISEIEKMSVVDLAELVKILEDKFGVSSAAPVMVSAAGAGAAAAVEKAEEVKTKFNVELTSAGENKISIIKALREITQMGLKDAKDLVDGAPKMIKEDAPKDEAEALKKKIEDAGGTVTLK